MSATPCELPATSILLAERNRPLRLLVCAMLAAILYLPALGRPALWEPDEGRYAEIAGQRSLLLEYRRTFPPFSTVTVSNATTPGRGPEHQQSEL